VSTPARVGVAVGIVAASLAVGGVVLASSSHTSSHSASTEALAPSAATPESAPPTTVATGPTTILALGDSNLAFSDAPVHQALSAAGIEGELRGVPSFGLKDWDTFWKPLVPGLVEAQNPDVVVVALGTNDVWTVADVQTFPARLDEMMRAIGNRRVVWVTHFDDRGGLSYPAQRINDAIREAPARWPNLAVLDLAPLIDANTNLLNSDLLHFSPEGQVFYGEEIAVAVKQAAALPVQLPVTLPPATLPGVSIPVG